MLFEGFKGKTLIPDHFNDLCVKMQVEARVTPHPNPGDPYHAMRLIHFRNFNNETVKITQQNKRKTVTIMPAQGEADVMLMPNEDFPLVEKGL